MNSIRFISSQNPLQAFSYVLSSCFQTRRAFLKKSVSSKCRPMEGFFYDFISRSSSCHILWPSPPQSSKTSLSIVPMVVQYTALQLHHCTTIGTQYAAVRKSTKVTTIQEEPRRRINKAFAYSSSLLESSLQNKLFAQQFKSWLGWWGAPKLVASKFPRFQIINLGFRISCAAK